MLRLLFAEQRLLQREAALRPLEVVEPQAPVDGIEQLRGVLARPGACRRNQRVFLQALVRRLRRRAGEAGIHRRADRVHVAPRAEVLATHVLLGRGEARRERGRQLAALLAQRLARGAEIDEQRRAVVTHVDVAGLDVEVQELVRVHFAQPVQQLGEGPADPGLFHRAAVVHDVLLQRAAALVAHDEVDGVIRAEEVEHAHHVRMGQAGERAPFLEETLHAVAERRCVLFRHVRADGAVGAQHEGGRQVLLDRHRRVVLVVREVNEREAAVREHAQDAVVLELRAFGQRLVGLRGHLPYDTACPCESLRTSARRKAASHISFHGLAMIQSMTGYAAASADSPRGRLSLELRSVNSRFLDLQFRIAEELRALEPALRELIVARVSRGKVDCRVYVNDAQALGDAQALDPQALERLKALGDQVTHAIPNAAPLRIADVLRWPGILAAAPADEQHMLELARGLCSRALEELVAARAREGAKLATVIGERVAAMRARLEAVTPLVPQALAAYKAKITERLREALGAEVSPEFDERVRAEIALFAAKVDIDEEMERLRTHLAEVERVLRKGGAAGKRLDFLAQELNREANTFASKAASAPLADCALELKVLVEQIREQVQNIE